MFEPESNSKSYDLKRKKNRKIEFNLCNSQVFLSQFIYKIHKSVCTAKNKTEILSRFQKKNFKHTQYKFQTLCGYGASGIYRVHQAE